MPLCRFWGDTPFFFFQIRPSKNPYGNKTMYLWGVTHYGFCSSKNPYGNKTPLLPFHIHALFCSSKNPYGNKTPFILNIV